MAAWHWIAGGAVVALLLVGEASAAEPEVDQINAPPPPKPDPQAEADACTAAAANKPATWLGRTPRKGESEGSWLSRVAVWMAYPSAPEAIEADPFYAAALARIAGCVLQRLADPNKPAPKPDIKPLPKAPDPLPPEPVTNKPTPNAYYAIKKGDTLFAVSKAAYGTSGGANVTAAKKINGAAYNARFLVDAPKGEQQYWAKRVSFLPKFGTPAEQAGSPTGGAGGYFATIWIPA